MQSETPGIWCCGARLFFLMFEQRKLWVGVFISFRCIMADHRFLALTMSGPLWQTGLVLLYISYSRVPA